MTTIQCRCSGSALVCDTGPHAPLSSPGTPRDRPMSAWLNALACAVVAAVRALQEPLDRRVFRFPSSDVGSDGALMPRQAASPG